ncbi:isoquinoline 1-oxidoreductase subunit alpha [Streptomyces humidus]|uniref:Isoquinoline 1-oxidoreductase subunit alpha n=1 Tax=Streptomyces humidus TaxID=52259 RepID=A0A918G1H0_9ACTN|nr:(2Fe-2S)-binding protein [Streptomyces humidus]GGS10796.1 isoquinoline 1-oxidoreductase subunit alpha [Streptomyces humidus]
MPRYSFVLNKQPVTVEAPADMPLLWVLRDVLGVTGPKYGCGIGVCRACTSHMDGSEIQPCVVPVADCAGRRVTTIEGLADGDRLHPVQKAWLECDVAQCGFCQPGQIMAAVALLDRTPQPTDDDIDRIENVCRCGTYPRIREAIRKASADVASAPVARE